MMKKTYINPKMEVVKIAANQQMLAGSTPLTIGADGSANDAEGRNFDFDDDEDEF